jgi:hypothetical protein
MKLNLDTIMDTPFYLERFQNAANQIDKRLLASKQLEVAIGLYKDSVCLKLYKKSWSNPYQDPLTAETRIFFSVWINDSIIKEQKLFYNIHALKLRQLKGYSIESRKFADTFRGEFKSFEHKWQNVSVKFGPLTLMEGWLKINAENFQREILELVNNFLEIEYLVDETLAKFKC